MSTTLTEQPFSAGMECSTRPRMACFDRPAVTVEELISAEGSDFVHLACWTVLGRRAEATEHAQFFDIVIAHDGKRALLAQLTAISPGDHFLRKELAAYLDVGADRRSKDAILQAAQVFLLRRARRIRAMHRRSRDFAYKMVAHFHAPLDRVRRPFRRRRSFLPADVEPRVAAIYMELCNAVDHPKADR